MVFELSCTGKRGKSTGFGASHYTVSRQAGGFNYTYFRHWEKSGGARLSLERNQLDQRLSAYLSSCRLRDTKQLSVIWRQDVCWKRAVSFRAFIVVFGLGTCLG